MSGYGLAIVAFMIAGIGVYALLPEREWVPEPNRRLWRTEIASGVIYLLAALVLAFVAGGIVSRGA